MFVTSGKNGIPDLKECASFDDMRSLYERLFFFCVCVCVVSVVWSLRMQM